MLVRYPALFKAGEICDESISNCLDIAPTVEEICELPASGKRHGLSLIKRMKKQGDDFTVSTSNGQQFGLFTQRCIRTRQYKYIWNLTDIDEFYVITEDPGEKINRINDPDYKIIITELKKSLHHALYDLDDPFVRAGWVDKQLLTNN
jgi:arylsulfatase A-like enzyme